MARHNREAKGSDQRGNDYEIGFQPDWLKLIKVARTLESGRQSTKTLFRNNSPREGAPGPRIRTRVASSDQQLEFEIDVNDPGSVIRRIIVVTEDLEFTIEAR